MDAAYQAQSLPFALRTQCFRLLARLRVIPEFQPWLEYSAAQSTRRDSAPFNVLRDCFVLGAPLCALLDLLGASILKTARVDIDASGLKPADQERFFNTFIQRVQLLECQGKLPFGEVLRPDDLFKESPTGFAKVVRTVERVLFALQDSYPGLYTAPADARERRQEIVEELLESERAHLAKLTTVANSAAILLTDLSLTEGSLVTLVVDSPRLLLYHEHVLNSLEELFVGIVSENWEMAFALKDVFLYNNAVKGYTSFVALYLAFTRFVDTLVDNTNLTLATHACTLSDLIPDILYRLSDYRYFLENILDYSSPTDTPAYNSLCASLLAITDLSDEIDEAGRQARTSFAIGSLSTRACIWNERSPDLGVLLLDDMLTMSPSSRRYAVYLFEKMMLCCREEQVYVARAGRRGVKESRRAVVDYPIAPWELGPAAGGETPLHVVHAIPTADLVALRRTSTGSFELDWRDEVRGSQTHIFCSMSAAQCTQWCSILEKITPTSTDLRRLDIAIPSPSHDPHIINSADYEEPPSRRTSHPRAWSVIGRKGARSESSSMLREHENMFETMLSPGLLPTLFPSPVRSGPCSPLSIDTGFAGRMQTRDAFLMGEMGMGAPPTPPPDEAVGENALLLDLTGQIKKEGNYPEAHGGFADVWKATWYRGSESRPVAVKVLRSRTDDPEMEDKMQRRLAREVNVWKQLEHPHVVPLLGTASDFGRHNAMVCPWYEHGSVTRYMEKFGDILSMTDRLQLLCEVASGLSYLHSFGIVHGDMSGSNILINESGKACICDFGLSSIVAELQCTSGFGTMGVGGAVRWADSKLYLGSTDDDDDDNDAAVPTVTTANDIYSFGSVMLEILSGRIPYHYLRTDAQVVIELHKGNKPRRPAVSFVTEAQWAFIQRCWADIPDARPDAEEVVKALFRLHRASLDYRRHTT